jgi:hypothetical protein
VQKGFSFGSGAAQWITQTPQALDVIVVGILEGHSGDQQAVVAKRFVHSVTPQFLVGKAL